MVKVTTDIPQDCYDLMLKDAKKETRSVSQQLQHICKMWAIAIEDEKKK